MLKNILAVFPEDLGWIPKCHMLSTVPDPGNRMPSSVLLGYRADVWCTRTHAGKTPIHINTIRSAKISDAIRLFDAQHMTFYNKFFLMLGIAA